MKKLFNRVVSIATSGFALMAAGMGSALAWTAPTAIGTSGQAVNTMAQGDFGFEVYDVVVNQILNGPIGFVGAALAIVFGVVQLFRSWVMGVVSLIVASMIINAEAIVDTMGMTI
jgi:hypothetical protein